MKKMKAEEKRGGGKKRKNESLSSKARSNTKDLHFHQHCSHSIIEVFAIAISKGKQMGYRLDQKSN